MTITVVTFDTTTNEFDRYQIACSSIQEASKCVAHVLRLEGYDEEQQEEVVNSIQSTLTSVSEKFYSATGPHQDVYFSFYIE